MTRPGSATLTAIALTILIGLAGQSPATAAPPPTPAETSGTAKCVWKWKKKRVVKKVKRNGKVKRVVRIKKRRVCLPPKPPAPARIGVNAYEFHFILSATRLIAGDTIADLNNRGEDPHDLHIARVDGTGEDLAVPETLPSTYTRLRFQTTPGAYRLWCSLPFHAARGMDTTIEAVPRSG